MKELTADAVVHSHAASDIVDVTSYRVAEVGDLVNKGDLCRQECVGGVFDQLGCFKRSDNDRRFNQIKRAVELLHYLDRFFLIAADHDTVRSHKVVDRCALAKKLGV